MLFFFFKKKKNGRQIKKLKQKQGQSYSQDHESSEEIANSDPNYEIPKELCRENDNESVGSFLFSPMKPVSNQ